MRIRYAMAVTAMLFPQTALARPTVIELYTSQGCSACPAADAMINELAVDPSILPLSFHVHYWDYMGWKDPFASEENTRRQTAYEQMLGESSVFTPQMIVDGTYSVAGADQAKLNDALAKAKNKVTEIPVSIAPDGTGQNLTIAINAGSKSSIPNGAVAWEVHFNRGAVTPVLAGENQGATLSSFNNVARLVAMPLTTDKENRYMLPLTFPEDGVAILLQEGPEGHVIGAAVYIKPGRDYL